MGKSRFWVVAATAFSMGCSWVSLDPGADMVTIRHGDGLEVCKRLGKTHTRTVRGLGMIPRRKRAVEEELTALARNEAVRMSGNVISPLSGVEDGHQDWAIYSCP